jgi:hypothetical protein
VPYPFEEIVMRTLCSLVGTIAATLTAAAGPVAAASHDYFVHAEAYNGAGYQPYSITVDALSGDVLSQPDDACGLRFEGDFNLHWHSDDFNLQDNIPADDGVADVWLPSATCGAWQGVTVETGDGLYTPPNDFSGYIDTYATAFWINDAGQKLVYLHQPCHPMPSCIQGPMDEALTNGWSESLQDPINTLRIIQLALGGDGKVPISLQNRLADGLTLAARATEERLVYRRQTDVGSLEKPLRQLEDAALVQFAKARKHLGTCRNALTRADRNAALRECDAALRAALAARVALDTGDAWIQ